MLMWVCESRGYQKVGENITEGVPDQHEAIDVWNDHHPHTLSPPLICFNWHPHT